MVREEGGGGRDGEGRAAVLCNKQEPQQEELG